MKKPGVTLVIVGIIVLLGVVLYIPTANLIKGNTGSNIARNDDGEIEMQDSAVYAQGELVSDFPDVPIYPGSKIIKSTEINNDGEYGYVATWETNAKTIPQVLNFYLAEAKKRNWTIVQMPDFSGRAGEEYFEFRINGQKAYFTVEREEDDEPIELKIDFPPKNQQ